MIAPVYSYATISEEELDKRIIPYERKHSSFDAINVGIIGFGIMGSRNAKTILQVPGVKLKAVCDLYKGRLERAKELYGTDLFVTQSYQEVLNRSDQPGLGTDQCATANRSGVAGRQSAGKQRSLCRG